MLRKNLSEQNLHFKGRLPFLRINTIRTEIKPSKKTQKLLSQWIKVFYI